MRKRAPVSIQDGAVRAAAITPRTIVEVQKLKILVRMLGRRPTKEEAETFLLGVRDQARYLDAVADHAERTHKPQAMNAALDQQAKELESKLSEEERLAIMEAIRAVETEN